MKISHTDLPSGQIPDNRRSAGQPRGAAARGQGAAQGDPAHSAPPGQANERTQDPGFRQRILELQRSAAGLQRALAGLEGLRRFFPGQGEAAAAREHMDSVRYRGQALLEPYADGLLEAVQRGDDHLLQGTMDELRQRLRGVAVELSRFETAEQNSRSLSGPTDPLGALVEAVRGAGERALQPDGRSALDLLG